MVGEIVRESCLNHTVKQEDCNDMIRGGFREVNIGNLLQVK